MKLANPRNLPEPEKLMGDIIENIEAGLQSFRVIALKLDASIS